MTPNQAAAIGILALMVLILAVVWLRRSAPPPQPKPTKGKKASTKAKSKPSPEREPEAFIDVRRVSGKVRALPIKRAQTLIEQDPLSALHVVRAWMNQPPPDKMIG